LTRARDRKEETEKKERKVMEISVIETMII